MANKKLLTPRLSRAQISARNQHEEVLKSVLRTYAKTANQRLRELEKQGLSGSSAAYHAISEFYNDNREFMTTTKSGELKFKTDTRHRTKEQLRRELMELDTFLFRAKTSTTKGVKAHYEKIKVSIGVQNTNDTKTQAVMDFFNDMDMDEFTQFWEVHNYHQLFKIYGSDSVIEMIAYANKRGISDEKMEDFYVALLNGETKDQPLKELKRYRSGYKKWLSEQSEDVPDLSNGSPYDEKEDNPFLTV